MKPQKECGCKNCDGSATRSQGGTGQRKSREYKDQCKGKVTTEPNKTVDYVLTCIRKKLNYRFNKFAGTNNPCDLQLTLFEEMHHTSQDQH